MFIRVWEYSVPPEHVEAFKAVYASDGDWARLFGHAQGYAGTQLYRDLGLPERFLTVDRWRARESWQDFLARFRPAYEALDASTEHLTSRERSLLEGSDGDDDG